MTEPTLTPRQLEILRMHAEGLTSRDIRKKLFVAENTVKTHNAAIRKKLGAHTMAQAVANAYQQGVLGLEGRLVDVIEVRDAVVAEVQVLATEREMSLWERADTLSILLRGMARRVGEWREKSDYYQQAAQTIQELRHMPETEPRNGHAWDEAGTKFTAALAAQAREDVRRRR